MQVEVNVRGLQLADVAPAAQRLDAAGVDVLADGEIRRDPFVSLTVAAAATERIRIASAITIAFARSPMVTAYAARNLHELSGGRFSLGLGTQVKRHVLRRFAAAWERPGPRLRDYVQAVRAIWRAWDTGASLAHHGDFYTVDLMTPEFDLGPNPHGPIDLAVAAVNAYNLATASHVADTVRVHAFCTPAYLRDVILPRLEAARPAGRGGPRVVGGGFVATGATEQEVARAREAARSRIAFYGTTRTYRGVLEHHGWSELADELRRRSDAGRWDALANVVPDEVVDAFTTTAGYGALGPALQARYGGIVDRVQLPCPALDGDWDAFAATVAAVQHPTDPRTSA